MNNTKHRISLGILLLAYVVFFSAPVALLAQEEIEQSNGTDGTVLVDGMEMELVDPASVSSESGEWYTVEGISSGGRDVGDFVVGPGKVELEVAPGESKTVMLSVTNRTGEERKFELSTEDMTGSSDPNKTVDLLGGARGPYSLKDYLQYGGSTFTLKNNERARIPVTVSVPVNADPGGRYGSVLVRTIAVERQRGEDGQLTSQSPVIARVGTLFFVTVPGEAERSGNLVDFTTVPEKPWFESGPIRFSILFENTGSVHLAPYGTISITNTFGQEVGYQELDPWFVLPGALRAREVEWTAERLLGRYTATLTLHHGYDDVTEEVTMTFWVLPWKVVAVTFLVVFIFVFLVRSFFKNFEFKRKS